MTRKVSSLQIKRTPSAKEDLLAALADPSRKAIFNSLLEGSKAVKVIAADLPISQPAVSQHLKIMKNVGLLLEHRQGRSHFYSLNPLVLDWLSMHFGLLRDSALGSIGMSQTTNMDNCEFDSVDRAVHAWSRLWPQIDELSSGLILRIFLLAHRIKELCTATITRHGLNLIEFQILSTLGTFDYAKKNSITTTDIAKRSLLPVDIIDLYLPKLVQQKLIELNNLTKTSEPAALLITAKGQHLLEQIFSAQKENELSPFYQLSPESLSRLATILRPLLQKLYK